MVHALNPHQILRRSNAAGAVAAAVLLVAGCGGSGGSSSAAPEAGPTTKSGAPSAAGVVVNLTGTEYAFAPSKLKVSAGKATIRFTNRGTTEHDFSIDALNVHLTAQAGKTAEVTVTLKPGTYTSYCSVPGHLQSGMQGTLTVS